MRKISSAMAMNITVIAELVDTRPINSTAIKNIVRRCQGFPRFHFLVMKKKANLLDSPVSAITIFNRKAAIKKGTMELPQVFDRRVAGVVTPVKQIIPRKKKLGHPISTRIQRYNVPKNSPTTPIPALVIGSGAGRIN